MLSIDLAGKTFSRWTVICRVGNTQKGQAMWLCRCQCGTERALKSIVLRRNISMSCGCWKSEVTTKRSTKHGHANSGKITPTYHSWAGMVARCTNQKNKFFQNYGGRGISVCNQWNIFAGFLADMGEKPPKHSLDRINLNGNYEPSNCRWATAQEQAQNKTSNRLITFNGETRPLIEWARSLGICHSTLQERLENWSVAESLTTPKLL